MKHLTGSILLIIGGILMVIGRAIGTIGVFEYLQTLAIASVSSEWVPLVNGIMIVIRFIADMGGWAIVLGAVLILIGLMRIGKFIIWIGLTFGLIALIVFILTQLITFTGLSLGTSLDTIILQLYNQFTYNSGISFIGTTIAIIGKICVKKVKEPKQPKAGQIEDNDLITNET